MGVTQILVGQGIFVDPVIDWEARYKDSTTGWERDHLNPAFNEWRARLGANPGSVILPGCGRSPEVVAFAEMGWKVTGLDLAETAVGYQQAALRDAGLIGQVVQTNIFHWQPEAPVDLVYEQTCLCALSPDQWSAYEQTLHQWLKPGGVLAALFMQTGREGGPPFHCELGDMRALFNESRWEWDVQSIKSEHPMGIHELGYLLTRL